jgi:hypothetical protein
MKGLTLEEAIHQHTKFNEFIEKYVSRDRSKSIIEFFGERELTLTSSPYSIKSGSVGCFPGGYIITINKLIEVSLVLDRVWEKFSEKRTYTVEELVVSSIFCEIGKLGTNDNPFFIKNDNEWEIKNRGLLYKYNPIYTNIKYSDSSIFTLQKNKITISENEFLSIKLYNSFLDEDNSHYFKYDNKPKSNLYMILNQAHQIINNS